MKIFRNQADQKKEQEIQILRKQIKEVDAIVIGAGAGLSTAAGFDYSGERFRHWFGDFEQVFGFHDMYSGGFYPFPKQEIFWAFWARNIYVNRYLPAPKDTYEKLLSLVKEKDYFVITTNVDHCFQKAGFDKKRLYYTQGDYGLFQSTNPTNQQNFDNQDWVEVAMESMGFVRDAQGVFEPPEEGKLKIEIPSALIPKNPIDASPVVMNLRIDGNFLEDEGWHRAAEAYEEFLRRHRDAKTLFLELGVGANTPGIIKYPFWRMTQQWEQAHYVCLNLKDAGVPWQIAKKSTLISGDIDAIVSSLVIK